ncbi:MAG: AMP-binding protein [Flavobacteriales bacterium]|nr:AMP-binding protein [Flavobacteriales bacterium]
MIKENFVEYLENSIKSNWDKLAVSDYDGSDYKYGDVAKQIARIHILFDEVGIKKGDKVALIGKNSARWSMAFVATVSYGAVAVPILPDFLPKDVHKIVNHSDSIFLFSSEAILKSLDLEEMKVLKGVFSLKDFKLILSRNQIIEDVDSAIERYCEKKYKGNFNSNSFSLPKIPNKELAEINYTSGTTGNSKGVMLLHNSLAANIRFARNNMPLKSGDSIVSFLPLAHAYGLAFEFLFPFSIGCHVTFLTKTPTPAIITAAFQKIKPRLILSVPLVIEKIYKKRIMPQVQVQPIKTLLKIPGINKFVKKKVLAGVKDGFGGNFHEVVIGGAALSDEIESFFRSIKLPFTIGYGMTECGPLVTYASWDKTKKLSCGKPVDTLEVKIDSNNPQTEVGEILIKGENVMVGYYKNEEETKKAIDEDGWLHTGDLGLIDNEGYIFIKGRSKSMILGPSGQNIYPEEIESMINNRSFISGSLIKLENNKIVALVYPDPDRVKESGVTSEELEEKFERYRARLNENLPNYMKVTKYIIRDKEFVKTPKQSIKRYLYL